MTTPMIQLIEIGAVLAGGIFGVLLARKNQFDLIGVFTLSFITAFAGGTLRDLFLGRRPLFWIENDHYAVIIFVIALLSPLLPYRRLNFERWLDVPDALGLGLFAITGARYAIEMETSLFIASLMGVVTGTAGGAISDVVCNEVPRLFRATPLYATCAFAGCWGYFGLRPGLPEAYALAGGIAIVVLLRFIALKWHIRLPTLRDTHEPTDA